LKRFFRPDEIFNYKAGAEAFVYGADEL
jgi:hypothetical protein